MIKFCEECGNMVRKFIKGKLVNGRIIEDDNGDLYGICINDHISLLKKSDTVVKYDVNHKEQISQDVAVVDTEYQNHLKELFAK